MVDISFTPTFHNTDFVDGTDRVRAGEPNGFNARFHAIETDLGQLSTVVAQVDTVLSQPVAPTVRRLSLPPVLAAFEGAPPWLLTTTGAASATAGSTATGIADLILPDGIQLVALRAVGQASGVVIAISLFRVPVGGGTEQTLAAVSGDASPFDRSAQIDAGFARVTTSTFRYLLSATVPTVSTGHSATIAGFQLSYLPA